MLNPSQTPIQILNQISEDAKLQEAILHIKPGKFKRSPDDPNYVHRSYYTRMLKSFLTDYKLMNAILTDKKLQTRLFRVFGYEGEVDFTLYPQCWIRDLPLLQIGKMSYLGDGIVLGTNKVSIDQKTVKVGRITIGDHTIIDQDCMLGHSTHIGHHTAIGVRSCIGVKTRIGNNCRIAEIVNIGHCCNIGNNVSIGQVSAIGNFTTIADGTKIPAFSRIPPKSSIE